MSLSGANTGLRPYTAIQLVEEACSRAGIPPAKLTSEIIEKSLDQLNLVFTSLLNRGVQLWKRQFVILPCYINTYTMPLPPGYNIVAGNTLSRRTCFRQIGTPFSDSGGNAALAFDDNFATACTQTSPNGSIGCLFATAVSVTQVGILFGAPGIFDLFYEYSLDGVNWTALDSANVNVSQAGQWYWVDLNGGPDTAIGWRVRSVGTNNLAIDELFFGNTPQETNLGAWNLDDYSNQPNKFSPGSVTNWYQQRNKDGPVLYVWPVPNDAAKYDVLTFWATQYLDTVSQISQSLDLPARWFDAITAQMARRLCRSLQEADFSRYPMLVTDEQEAMMLAAAEERDPSPTNYDLNLDVYTR